jgi:DNA gyrase/topoisomerase IV subunit A
MSAFGVTEEPVGAALDLTSPAMSSELSDLEARLQVLNGLIDAWGKLPELNKAIQFCSDRPAALEALQHEPFCYSREQAKAVLDMPMSWQTGDQLARLRAERDRLTERKANLREHGTEAVALHWFG